MLQNAVLAWATFYGVDPAQFDAAIRIHMNTVKKEEQEDWARRWQEATFAELAKPCRLSAALPREIRMRIVEIANE